MPSCSPEEARDRFATARVARLATVRRSGEPHLVPITFAVRGDQVLSVVDAKPKRTTALQRLDNVEANPAVSLLVDEYDDDWNRLWWARADGHAVVVRDEGALRDAVDLLSGKYAQYAQNPPEGPLLVVTVTKWIGWTAR